MKLWDELKKQMLRHSDQKICEGRAELSFENAAIFAEIFAEKLSGIRCCAIMCKSEMAASMALLACFAGGVTAVPLSKRYGNIHCKRILEKISPDAVITDNDGAFQIHLMKNPCYVEPNVHPALIMCTSGTTGSPKGVMLSEKSILTNVFDIATYFNIGKTDSILITRPLYHCAVLTGEFLISLVKGSKIRFYSDRFDPEVILRLIDNYKVTVFCATPTLLRMLIRFDRSFKADALKHVCISGECMDGDIGTDIANKFRQAEIYHVYGLTEAGPRVCYLPPVLFRKYPDRVGIPLKSISLKLIKSDGDSASCGEEGVLWIKGENIMSGYYNDWCLTKKVLQNGWLCTGDIAEIDDAGLLKIKGRKDNLIIRAGMNIYPQEIESALRADKRVYEVVAYGYKGGMGQVQIGLKIAGDFDSEDDVLKLCSACLPSYEMPSRIELVSDFVMSVSGKVMREISNV